MRPARVCFHLFCPASPLPLMCNVGLSYEQLPREVRLIDALEEFHTWVHTQCGRGMSIALEQRVIKEWNPGRWISWRGA